MKGSSQKALHTNSRSTIAPPELSERLLKDVMLLLGNTAYANSVEEVRLATRLHLRVTSPVNTVVFLAGQ
jgi:hypothetical protein